MEENENLITLHDLIPAVFNTARRYRALYSALSPMLMGVKLNEEQAEASIFIGFLQRAPLEASMRIIEAGDQRVMVFNMFYSADSFIELQ